MDFLSIDKKLYSKLFKKFLKIKTNQPNITIINIAVILCQNQWLTGFLSNPKNLIFFKKLIIKKTKCKYFLLKIIKLKK